MNDPSTNFVPVGHHQVVRLDDNDSHDFLCLRCAGHGDNLAAFEADECDSPEARNERNAVKRVEVGPSGDETALVILDGSVRLVVGHADVSASDHLVFYRGGRRIAHVRADGVPLEVPRLVRRAIEHGESGVWG